VELQNLDGLDRPAGEADPLDAAQEASLLRRIIARSGDVAYSYRVVEPRGFEYVSDSIASLIGYSPAEYYADPKLVSALVHPDDHNVAAYLVRNAPAQGADVVLRWIRRDGGVIWTRQRVAVQRDGDGNAVNVEGLVRQVSVREAESLRLAMVQRVRRSSETEPMPQAQVLIADDHDLTRTGLRALLNEDPRLQVVAEARSGDEAVRMAHAHKPDLVLMDMRMPGGDGLEATRAIKMSMPTVTVLILSMFEDADALLEAVKAGAAGYVLKSASESEMRTAIWEALAGDLPVDPRLAREVLRRLATERAAQPRAPAVPPLNDPLSPREHEVLALLARGYTNREIGDELIITPHTVKIHVEHILAKLEVSDRTQAAVRAIELGFLTPEPTRARIEA
jgi:PAS domain S-box-containing protein